MYRFLQTEKKNKKNMCKLFWVGLGTFSFVVHFPFFVSAKSFLGWLYGCYFGTLVTLYTIINFFNGKFAESLFFLLSFFMMLVCVCMYVASFQIQILRVSFRNKKKRCTTLHAIRMGFSRFINKTFTQYFFVPSSDGFFPSVCVCVFLFFTRSFGLLLILSHLTTVFLHISLYMPFSLSLYTYTTNSSQLKNQKQSNDDQEKNNHLRTCQFCSFYVFF